MIERPIPFSAPMVRATLDGTKTQTRRVLKSEPVYDGRFAGGWKLAGRKGREAALCSPMIADLCPYGQPGDRLWVREAWKAHTTFDHLPPRDIPQSHVWYMADDGYKAESRFRQSMHMPRWASRISLEITGVRVERLQDISTADSWAEGIPGAPPDGVHVERIDEWVRWSDGVMRDDPKAAYRTLWEQINGPESWAANPWLWVVEFKVVKP